MLTRLSFPESHDCLVQFLQSYPSEGRMSRIIWLRRWRNPEFSPSCKADCDSPSLRNSTSWAVDRTLFAFLTEILNAEINQSMPTS